MLVLRLHIHTLLGKNNIFFPQRTWKFWTRRPFLVRRVTYNKIIYFFMVAFLTVHKMTKRQPAKKATGAFMAVANRHIYRIFHVILMISIIIVIIVTKVIMAFMFKLLSRPGVCSKSGLPPADSHRALWPPMSDIVFFRYTGYFHDISFDAIYRDIFTIFSNV